MWLSRPGGSKPPRATLRRSNSLHAPSEHFEGRSDDWQNEQLSDAIALVAYKNVVGPIHQQYFDRSSVVGVDDTWMSIDAFCSKPRSTLNLPVNSRRDDELQTRVDEQSAAWLYDEIHSRGQIDASRPSGGPRGQRGSFRQFHENDITLLRFHGRDAAIET